MLEMTSQRWLPNFVTPDTWSLGRTFMTLFFWDIWMRLCGKNPIIGDAESTGNRADYIGYII